MPPSGRGSGRWGSASGRSTPPRKEGDKRMAIETVLGMEPHNGITKQEFINALGWLMERQGGAGEREDVGWIG